MDATVGFRVSGVLISTADWAFSQREGTRSAKTAAIANAKGSSSHGEHQEERVCSVHAMLPKNPSV